MSAISTDWPCVATAFYFWVDILNALALAASGLAIGIPMALATSRLLSSVLYGLSSTDPVSLLIGIAILGAVTTLAGYIPARRATKVEPMVALRYE